MKPPVTLKTARIVNLGGFAAPMVSTMPRSDITRPPGACDDDAHGFAAGQFWQCPSGLYVATDVAAGRAVWQRAPAQALPLDTLPDAVAAYATRRLRADYRGPALTVRHPEGESLAIGFLADGSLDCATLDGFLQGATGRVAIWHDQSGQAADAAQPDPSCQPALLPSNRIGNSRAVVFDSPFHDTPERHVWLTMPPLVRAASDANAAMLLSRWASSIASCNPLQWDGAGTASANLYMDGSVHINLRHDSVATTLATPQLAPMLCGWSSSPDATRMFPVQHHHSFPPPAPGSLAGGTLGANSAHDISGRCEISCVVLYSRAITVLEQRLLALSITAHFALRPQTRGVVRFIGDSITEMAHATALQSFPRRAEALLARPALCHNAGAWGQCIEYLSGTFALWHAAQSRPEQTPNICFIQAGSNNIALLDQDGPTIWRALQHLLEQARAAGYHVIVATILPRLLPESREQTRQELNRLIRAHWHQTADALCDFAVDPQLGAASAAHDPALYPDGCHPSDLGVAIMARLAADCIDRLADRHTRADSSRLNAPR